MSCGSALYAVSTRPSTFSFTDARADFAVPLYETVRRFGQHVCLEGFQASVREGYYKVDATVCLTSPDAGTYGAFVAVDGNRLPGAYSQVEVSADGTATLPLTGIVRNCCKCPKSVTVCVTGAAGTSVEVVDAALTVVRL